ncbi:TetR family transcriptional regulator C-terminal domain-containing protein [Streptomyces sp. NPDC008139]|uniref:TetR family transcriptional regulator C-terminal domain-containing protein n=1 Tax=Streptomyces sp. NPDC008139 TaxID=3364814 RepID=UPI0036EE1139
MDALRMLLEAPINAPAGPGRGCLMANSACELGNADPEVLAHAHRTYETSTALIGDCVARAQREGDLPAGADPIALARALLAAQQGIVFMGRTGLDTATLTATARALAAQLPPDRSGDQAQLLPDRSGDQSVSSPGCSAGRTRLPRQVATSGAAACAVRAQAGVVDPSGVHTSVDGEDQAGHV